LLQGTFKNINFNTIALSNANSLGNAFHETIQSLSKESTK